MPPKKQMTFEDRLRRLQQIVLLLENGSDGKDDELSLEQSVALYKEGVALSRACREQLEKVRNEVRLVAEDGGLEPFPFRDDARRDEDDGENETTGEEDA